MIIPFVIAHILLVYIIFKKQKELDIDFKIVAQFISFLTFVAALKLSFNWDKFSINPTFELNPSSFLLVYWEDIFFAYLPLMICEKIKNTRIKTAIWVFFSLFFAAGHLYQGIGWALVTLIYPYFISRKYILKTSLATVMMCHFLYDFSIFFTYQVHKIIYFSLF